MKKWKKSRNYRRMRDESGNVIADIITVDGVNVEVSEKIFLAYSQEDRRERYISEDTADRLFSLEQLSENRGQSDYMEMNTFPSAEEIFLEQEEDQSWEERKKRLPTVLEELNPDELELIQALYFKGLSAREYAKQLGVYHRTVLYRKEKVLKKFEKNLCKSFIHPPAFFGIRGERLFKVLSAPRKPNTSSTGNHSVRRAPRSARHDPEGASSPPGERDCHLRKRPLARPLAMTLSEPIMRHHAWPPRQRGKAALGLKAVETLGIRLCRSRQTCPVLFPIHRGARCKYGGAYERKK